MDRKDAERVGVEQMPAGRELDALVAERVMGLPPVTWDEHTRCPECGGEMRYCGARSRCFNCNEWRDSAYREYSEDIAAAWEVVEAMQARGHFPGMEFGRGRWRADMGRPGNLDAGEDFWVTAWGYADTAPLAICRAALAALQATPTPPEKRS